jgi:hypothetical protein
MCWQYQLLHRSIVGVSKSTIKKYLTYLEAAFLIKTVHRVDINAKTFKRATRSRKPSPHCLQVGLCLILAGKLCYCQPFHCYCCNYAKTFKHIPPVWHLLPHRTSVFLHLHDFAVQFIWSKYRFGLTRWWPYEYMDLVRTIRVRSK